MLRGDDRWAVAVRTPDGGIAVHADTLPTWGRRWKRVPVVRGLVVIAGALPLGAKALQWSVANGLVRPRRRSLTVLRMVGMALAVLALPPYLTDRLVGGLDNGWVSGVVANVLTVGVLVAYAALVGRLAMVRTLFQYHGAEHKVVAAHEAGGPMTPEWAARYSTRHVRCGTSLLLVIAVVAAVASMLHLPTLLAVPLIGGVAAELQLRASVNLHRSWVRALLRPGLALQRLTTREPSLAQLEVAIAAFDAVTASAAQPSSIEAVAVPA
ncbi:MAG: hypothetical protein JWN29_4227 [Acidimicrobiales bacterium]|nr:hypothetical protein [Acidimicrobiales bacterium]